MMKRKVTISTKFFWVTVVLTLASFGLIWADRISLAIDEAGEGEWAALLSFAALLVGLLIAFSIIFKEMKKSQMERMEKEEPKKPVSPFRRKG